MLLAAAGLAACASVGPDYHGAPAMPAGAGSYVRATADADRNAPLPAQWWKTLDDADLDQLIRQALADSPDLAAARARLREARAGLDSSQAQLLPTASASALGLGLETAPGTASSRTLHLYTTSFLASWEVDLFGGGRRGVEAAAADSQAAAADLADLQVALAAEVAQNYIQLRLHQQQLQQLDISRQADETALLLTEQRRSRGVATVQELQQRVGALAATVAQSAQAQGDILAALDQLALLCGRSPAALDEALAAPQPLPRLPATLAIGDPTQLLQNRPDIRAAERRLAASQAEIGVQKAGYFPKLTLMGGLAFAAENHSNLFDRSNASLLGLPYLSWNVLDFGRTAAAVDKAQAGRDEALAQYRGKVLTALNDANSALSRYGQQQQKVRQLDIQRDAAVQQLRMEQALRAAGAASEIDLADSRKAVSVSRQQTLAADAELLGDYVLLQKSLGLGWQSEEEKTR
jgi:NodT family efflux transporter outer membrane factor (OMF) lipoprotein